MSVSKQLYEFVKASEEKDLPDTNGIYIVRNQDKSIYEMYFDKSSPTKFHYLNSARQKAENVIYSWKFVAEWLKPIKIEHLSEQKVSEQLTAYIHEIDSLRGINRELGEKIEQGNGWISCDDRLPPQNRDVLSIETDAFGEMDILISQWNGEHWYSPFRERKITHWQPLPTAPPNNSKT